MARAQKSRYIPKHPQKYRGDPNNIICRSSWERGVCRWLDFNSDVVQWSSEEIVIPYLCKTDSMAHRYFVDFCFKTKNGKIYLVEVKPDYQTRPPEAGKRKTKYYTEQVLTYAKNVSKWEAALDYCKKREWNFRVWTERTLEQLKIL